MEKWCYYIFKSWIALSLRLFFSDIRVVGRNNIPKGKGVIFIANHWNTLIDPLLITCSVRKKIWFLTRSDVFKSNYINRLLSFFGPIPAYRAVDGFKAPLKNQETFNLLKSKLNKKDWVALFPEGTHLQHRTLRRFKKGVFRIWEQNPTTSVVPIAINFSSLTKSHACIEVKFGKPFQYEAGLTTKELEQALEKELCTVEQFESLDPILNLDWPARIKQNLLKKESLNEEHWSKVKSIIGDKLIIPFTVGSYVINMVKLAASLPLMLVGCLFEIPFWFILKLVLKKFKDHQFHLSIHWLTKHLLVTILAWICFFQLMLSGLSSINTWYFIFLLGGIAVFPKGKKYFHRLLAQIRFLRLRKSDQEALKNTLQHISYQ
ncbi:1-acyl-sn-glycerol-3-phosphate acyltransferase [Luteibaculum oceani]|uniref:Phospholipid/glycerol acyltransferase domain-containing protein n=1 Tax=Luteibaculum oceani TaxID=1294296 RepID=A0A5C6UYH1_9FLAO|nr:1-acyl-sn-glycerol-3-phosphate acyltransferase [Luteibaculum oceani]TXC78337.1 hypothetical protein FRX97_08385 [Luteibaculum oceani]